MTKYLTSCVKSIFIILVIFVTNCGPNNDIPRSSGTDGGEAMVELEERVVATQQNAQAPPPPQDDIQEVERKLIKEGQIEFETDDLSSTKETITDAVTKYDGYISSDREFKSPGRRSNRMEIRVPADNFDNLLDAISEGVDIFDNRNIETKDVTEEFVDTQARLKTKNELENRYLELLEKATSVKDMLAIERQIGQLRSEIESIEGRLKYLENRIAYATLSATFYEEVTGESTGFGKQLKDGFKEGWHSLVGSFVWLISLWPFIIIFIGLLVGIRWWWKKRRRVKAP